MAYHLEKLGAIIQRPEGMPEPGPYYTCILDMAEVADFPYDFALYFSTDHHDGIGGLWVYFCNGDPATADWVSYDDALAAGVFDYVKENPSANPIFIDTVQGDGHTETPHAQVIDGKVFLSYHKNGLENTQRTILAISENGIVFDRLYGDNDSIILRDADEDPGNGHTGYFRWAHNVFAGIQQKYVGYSLHGGGDDYYSAIWASDDAIHWQRREILIPLEGQSIANPEHMIVWHEMDPASIRKLSNGDYVGICGVGNRASGNAERIVELYQVFLSADGCTLTRPSEKIAAVGPLGAPDAEELTSPSMCSYQGELRLIYVGAKEAGAVNTIMCAKVTFTEDAPQTSLPEEDAQRHLYRA